MAENNHELIGFIASTVEAMRDQMATKSDVNSIREQMVTRDVFDAGIVSIRGDIERVELRLEAIEHSVNSRFEHVEGEISRLRSAVYVLGKDRPDVLLLLGQSSG